MEWIQVSITTATDGIDIVCDKLTDIGISGFEIEDEKDFTEFLENNTKYWDFVDEELVKSKQGATKVKVYVEAENAADTLAQIKAAMAALKATDTDGTFGTLEVETASMLEEDWANNWKKYFKPICVGEKMLICPEWEDAKDFGDRKVFKVNPGMTFGTGTHHSTQMCIAHLENAIQGGEKMLDLGCGSGILSIISLILGAEHATAVDIDENCVHVAYENLDMNGIERNRYTVYSGDILSDSTLFDKMNVCKYDVVAANIVADVIIALLPTAEKLIRDGGTFICSGIIDERLDDVTDAIEKSRFEISKIVHSGGWASILCKFIENS
ncbi:MAG: 50S ribosomal protein L11 methyltransferase [Clostridia bacterium]|nr:50S ribosomal protein L11 methyltransferase [Clostridia bacterium]